MHVNADVIGTEVSLSLTPLCSPGFYQTSFAQSCLCLGAALLQLGNGTIQMQPVASLDLHQDLGDNRKRVSSGKPLGFEGTKDATKQTSRMLNLAKVSHTAEQSLCQK